MTNQHPITPPPELLEQLSTKYIETSMSFADLVTEVARWGADQELEACVELTRDNDGYDAALGLRATRRPKPPSLKEQALATLEVEPKDDKELIVFDTDQVDIIRRALEALPND